MKPMKKINSKIVYKTQWMTLMEDEIEYFNGNRSKYGVVDREPFVLVIPIRKDEVLLVEQYRYPVDKWTLEFPQGGKDENELPVDAAKRELEEETGYKIKKIKELGHLYEAAGFAMHDFWVYVAEVDEAQRDKKLDESEAGLVEKWFNLKTFKKMILNGEIEDAPSLAAFTLYLLDSAENRGV